MSKNQNQTPHSQRLPARNSVAATCGGAAHRSDMDVSRLLDTTLKLGKTWNIELMPNGFYMWTVFYDAKKNTVTEAGLFYELGPLSKIPIKYSSSLPFPLPKYSIAHF